MERRTAVHRALYGYNDHSNKGGYFYKRKGLLDTIKHKKINNGVIMVESKDRNKVAFLLKKNKAFVKIINLYSK